jgi:Holliday junction resolvase RusA-like endonuclease
MKADNEAVVKAAITRSLRGVYIQKKVRMEYLWVEKNQRRDLDNISSFGRKVIQDELVKSRILQNDGWANIIGFSDSFAVDKQDPRIEVRIIEVDE